jgi:hypothetical protein
MTGLVELGIAGHGLTPKCFPTFITLDNLIYLTIAGSSPRITEKDIAELKRSKHWRSIEYKPDAGK